MNKTKSKMDIALEKIEKYIKQHYTSNRPKERLLDPDKSELIFNCEQCGNETLLRLVCNKLACQFCGYKEQMNHCSICERDLPESFLFNWNEEHGAMICEDCDENVK